MRRTVAGFFVRELPVERLAVTALAYIQSSGHVEYHIPEEYHSQGSILTEIVRERISTKEPDQTVQLSNAVLERSA